MKNCMNSPCATDSFLLCFPPVCQPKEIAKKLDLSDGTTRVYLHNLYAKINVKRTIEAMVLHHRAKTTEVRSKLEARRRACASQCANWTDLLAISRFEPAWRPRLDRCRVFLGPHSRAWEVAVRGKQWTIAFCIAARTRGDCGRRCSAANGRMPKQTAESGLSRTC